MWRFWLSVFLFIFAVPLIPFAIFGELPGDSWIENPNSSYVFLVGIILLTSDVFLPIPSSLIAVFMGARLGAVVGALGITLGLGLGSTIGYYAGWYLGNPLIMRYVHEEQRKVIRSLETQFSYLALAMLRAVPVLAEASVLLAGTVRFKSRQALVTLWAANMGLSILYATFGSESQGRSSALWLFLGAIGVPMCAVLTIYFASRVMHVLKR